MEAECDGGHHLLECELVKQALPALVVVISSDHLGDRHISAGCQCGHGGICVLFCLVLCELQSRCQIVVHGELLTGCRESSLPVASAQECDVTGCQAALVGIRLVEEVCDLRASSLALCISCGIKCRIVPLVYQCLISFCIHAVRSGISLRCQNIVDRFVRSHCNSEIVIACVKDISLCAVGVISSQLSLRNIDSDRLGSTGLEGLCFAKSAELDGSLLDAVSFVIVGVRGLEVDLNGLLACHAASVCHIYSHVEAVRILFYLEAAHIEGRVAQAVTEGISNSRVVVEVACACSAHNDVFISGLRIAVSEVDAFLIYAVHSLYVSAFCVQAVALIACIRYCVEVDHCGVLHVVVPVGVYKRSGRGNCAGKKTAYTDRAGLSHVADPHAGVDAVVYAADLGIKEIQFDRVGSVEQDYDLLECAVVLESLEACQHIFLFLGKSKVVAVAF